MAEQLQPISSIHEAAERVGRAAEHLGIREKARLAFACATDPREEMGTVHRLISGVGGAALMLRGLRRSRSASGLAQSAIGGALLYHSVTGQSILEPLLGSRGTAPNPWRDNPPMRLPDIPRFSGSVPEPGTASRWSDADSGRRTELDPLRRRIEVSMFEVIGDAGLDQVIPAVHYALRLLRHRHEIADASTGYRVAGLESEPSSDETDLALRLIGEIERREEMPLRSLDESQTRFYTGILADLVQERTRSEPDDDPRDGHRLLEALRAGRLAS